MSNFRAWVEETRAGNFLVRHEDKNGRRDTDYKVEKYDAAMLEGEKVVGKSLANALCEKVRRKYYQNELGEKDLTLRVDTLIEQYIDERDVHGLSRYTLLHNRNSLAVFVRDNAIATLSDITAPLLQEWKSNLVERQMSNETIRGYLSDLRTFLNWLVEMGKLEKSPFGRKMLPQKNDPIPRFYTLEEYHALDQSLSSIDHPTRVLCSLAHCSGLRKQEGLQALYDDVQWHEAMPELLLRKEITKGKKQSRLVPLEPDTLALIGSMKPGRLVDRSVYQVDHFFQRAKARTGLDPRLTIHGLRHTYIKNLFQNGKASTQEAMRLAGHRSHSSMNVYGNFEPSHHRDIIQRAYEERKRKERLLGLENPGIQEVI